MFKKIKKCFELLSKFVYSIVPISYMKFEVFMANKE